MLTKLSQDQLTLSQGLGQVMAPLQMPSAQPLITQQQVVQQTQQQQQQPASLILNGQTVHQNPLFVAGQASFIVITNIQAIIKQLSLNIMKLNLFAKMKVYTSKLLHFCLVLSNYITVAVNSD